MSEEITDDMSEEQLTDDINEEWWTVIGFVHETWERQAWHFDCLNPRMAEDLAQMEARDGGYHIAVVGVIAGKIWPSDEYATWVDPDITSQPEMNEKLRELGYLPYK